MNKPSPDPWNARWDGPKELLPLLAAGKLEQTCPNCGKTEPAGGRCTGCGQIPGWKHWHRPVQSAAMKARNERGGTFLRHKAQKAGKQMQNGSQGVSEEVKK